MIPDADDAGASIARSRQISVTKDLAPHARGEVESMKIAAVRSIISYLFANGNNVRAALGALLLYCAHNKPQLTSENIHAVLVDDRAVRMTRSRSYSGLCHDNAPLVFLEVVCIKI